jgi:hypothetical protein
MTSAWIWLSFPQSWVNIYQTTSRNISEDSDLDITLLKTRYKTVSSSTRFSIYFLVAMGPQPVLQFQSNVDTPVSLLGNIVIHKAIDIQCLGGKQ